MCALLAALGGSLLLLAGCSSFAERFSRPESRAESTTAAESSTAESSTAESRASESNATESGEDESTAEASGEAESGAEQLAEGESAGGESAADTAADGETLAAAESSAEGAAAETTAAESTAAEKPQTLARRFRNLTVEGDSLSVELAESIDGNFHFDYDGEPALQTEDRENDTLYVKESGTAGKLLRIAVPRGTNLGTLSFRLGAGDLTVTGVSADSLTISAELGDVTLQTVNVQRALLSLTAGELRADALSTSDFKADAELSNLTVTLAEPIADFTLFARTGQGTVRSQGAVVDSKFLQRGNSGKRLLLRSEMGNVTISGIQ